MDSWIGGWSGLNGSGILVPGGTPNFGPGAAWFKSRYFTWMWTHLLCILLLICNIPVHADSSPTPNSHGSYRSVLQSQANGPLQGLSTNKGNRLYLCDFHLPFDPVTKKKIEAIDVSVVWASCLDCSSQVLLQAALDNNPPFIQTRPQRSSFSLWLRMLIQAALNTRGHWPPK